MKERYELFDKFSWSKENNVWNLIARSDESAPS